MLATLAQHAGLVMTHRQLLHEVWGTGRAEESHYLPILMCRLRQKFEDNALNPHQLLTEVGAGYSVKMD